jgi:hypothetical protein
MTACLLAERRTNGQEEMRTQVDSLASRIDVNQEDMKAIFNASQEQMEANPGELQSVVVHQEVAVEMNQSSEGPASSRRASPTDEETDEGRWWVPAEVGRYTRTVHPPCHSCTAQGMWSSGTRPVEEQGACSVNEG